MRVGYSSGWREEREEDKYCNYILILKVLKINKLKNMNLIFPLQVDLNI